MVDISGEMIGKYRVIRNLASGSQGTVYHAYDPDLEREVALKVLHPHLTTPEVVARFRREAQIVASINHPNIAGISEIGEHDGSHFIVIEFVPHTSRELIDRGPLDITRAVTIAQQAALALEAARASRRGITHHDIKPENLLLTSLESDGVLKLIDFGIAHAADMAPMTQAGAQWGTPYYMPPEQWIGERGDTRSDVYSLGVVMYQMLSGQVPFNSTAANALAQQNEIARQHLEDEAASLRSAREDVTDTLDAVVAKCMAKLPEDRYQTPGELAAELASVLGVTTPDVSQPVSPPQVQESAPVPVSVVEEEPRRNRMALIAAGGFGAMIVIVLIVLVASQPSGGGPPPPRLPVIGPPMIETPTATHSPVPAPTEAPVAVLIKPLEHTATPEQTSTVNPTPTPYPLQPTYTPLPTSTPIPAPTTLPTITPLPTPTPLPTSTPIPPATPTSTLVPTATLTITSVPTATYTPMPTLTPIPAPTASPTMTPTRVPILPDLVVGPVSVLPESPAIWDEVTFTTSVSNQGTTSAGEFTVGLYDGDETLYERTVGGLVSNTAKEVTLVWRAEVAPRPLSIVVDRDNRIEESGEQNNSRPVPIVTAPTATHKLDSVTWHPAQPEIGESVRFWAHVANISEIEEEHDVGVAFYIDGRYHSWARLNETASASVEQVDSDTWEAEKGTHEVAAVLYPTGFFNYSSRSSWKEFNHRYVVAIGRATYDHTRLPNLAVTDVEFSQENVAGTDTFYLDTRVTVLNKIGDDGLRPPPVKNSFDVRIEFKTSFPCPFGAVAPCEATLRIDGIDRGVGVTRSVEGAVPLPLPRSGGVHEFRVVVTVDPLNVVDESDELDNTTETTGRVTNN